MCCEDTRRTGRLLQHAGVDGRGLAVANEHTEAPRVGEVLEVLAAGTTSRSSPTPAHRASAIPGERLVRRGHRRRVPGVGPCPGPSAAVAALVVSGLPTARFVFEGFLPRSGRARRQRLAELAAERRTIVLYEAPHRVLRTVADLAAPWATSRPVAVGRELTKLHEEVVRGTLGRHRPRGAAGRVRAGRSTARPLARRGARRRHDPRRARPPSSAAGRSTRDAVAAVAERLGVPKRRVYAVAVGTLGG